jgi:hypothetical protein
MVAAEAAVERVVEAAGAALVEVGVPGGAAAKAGPVGAQAAVERVVPVERVAAPEVAGTPA